MSTIPDYNTNPGAFVGWLDGQALDALPGHKNPKLTELVELLKGKITISADSSTALSKEQLEKLLAAYLTDPASINGGWAMGQFQGGQDAAIAAIKGMIERGEKQTPPVTHWTVPEFMLLSLSALTMDRIDDDLITTFTGVMAFQDNQRKGLREELAEMTAELKIYGVIQSEINKVLSAASNQTFKTDFNLMDYKLYGYESDAKFREGPEFKLLEKMQNRGITKEVIDMVNFCGVDIDKWLTGFDSPRTSVQETIALIRNHPLVPPSIQLHGLLINPSTGELEKI